MPEQNKRIGLPRFEVLIINLISRIGIIGTFFAILMINATKEQYREFIDTFILLKFSKNNSFLPSFVVIYLVIGFGGTIFFLVQRLKIKDERIRALEKDLRNLQEMTEKNKAPKKTNKKV
jgi:hypothetical protein